MNPQLIGLGIDTAGAFAMMGLALWVWRVRPESRANRTFAWLVSTLAVTVLFLNIAWVYYYTGRPESLERATFSTLAGVGLVIAAVLAIRFATLFTRASPRTSLIARVSGAAVAALHLVIALALDLRGFARFFGTTDAVTTLAATANFLGIMALMAAIYYLLVRSAVVYRWADAEADAERWRIAAIAIALGAWPLYVQAAAAVSGPDPAAGSPLYNLLVVPSFIATAVWLWAAKGTGGRLASTTALSILGVTLAGVFASASYGWDLAINGGAIGILRFGGTLLLAYAILRHQLFEIDLKLKWTISRGTVAGTVLVTFFVVSQLVENIASERFGLIAGSVAAGILLFLIQPLLRFADRVADRAMPNVQDTEEYRTVRKRDVYLAALEGALVDGVVSERERDMLVRLQDQLGLTATEARSMERDLAGVPA